LTQVITEFTGQHRQLVDPPPGGGEVEGGVVARTECVPQQLTRVPGCDHRGVPFDTDDGAVLTQQSVCEAVVGVDLHLPARFGQVGQKRSQFVGQFLGSLVGERDAERFLGFDRAGLDEVL